MDPALYERLQKILALARNDGASPGETAAAMNKIREIMDRNNITDETLAHAAFTHKRVPNILSKSKKPPQFAIHLITEIGRIYNTLMAQCPDGSLLIIGRRSHIELAEYTWTFLSRELKNYRRDFLDNMKGIFRKEFPHRAVPKDFAKKVGDVLDQACLAWVHGAVKNIPAFGMTEEERANMLAYASANTAYTAKKSVKPARKMKKEDMEDTVIAHGYQSGRKTTINNAMNHESPTPQLTR